MRLDRDRLRHAQRHAGAVRAAGRDPRGARSSECKPVYLEVPGKGHFFAEPLAKTGASDEVQLYGEVGLAYGNERPTA